MIYPQKEQFINDSQSYGIIPVFREIRADFETPLSIYLKVKAQFLLESIERGENVGRYSMIGLGKKVEIIFNGNRVEFLEYGTGGDGEAGVPVGTQHFEAPNPLLKVREYFAMLKAPEYEGLPPFWGGAVGYLGYETVRYFEDIPVRDDEDGVPDGLLIVPEVLLVYDSVKRSVCVIVTTAPGEEGTDATEVYDAACTKIETIAALLKEPLREEDAVEPTPDETTAAAHDMDKDYFMECIEKCKNHIVEGDIIQVVFSQRFRMETAAHPFEIYKALRILNPSPYLFYLDFGDFQLIGSSPEVMVRVQNGEVLLKPIAGTRKRGATIREDNALAAELLADPKEKAEHIMLVDLARNDVGRVSLPGSVEVTDYMTIERYSHVMHIVSTVKGALQEDKDVFDVIEAVFPAGTLSGAPKVRAMEIIANLEPTKRGPYGGMVLYMGFNGNLDSCITIRTIQFRNQTAVIQAGAGIVADSVPETEYQETIHKANALFAAVKSTSGK